MYIQTHNCIKRGGGGKGLLITNTPALTKTANVSYAVFCLTLELLFSRISIRSLFSHSFSR